jgi:hypothetical protein
MPQRLAADSAYGSASMLNWSVKEKQITPYIPVIDKSKREDGPSRVKTFATTKPTYICTTGKT